MACTAQVLPPHKKRMKGAFDDVFAELDHLEQHLGDHRYLAGEYLTEADVRLFTTLIRFDAVYYSHFKCNSAADCGLSNLSNWLRECFSGRGWPRRWILSTSKEHYYASHRTINPTGGSCQRGRCKGLMLGMIASG